MENQLVFNSVICLSCNRQLVSRHRHDYQVCGCENNTHVDGGFDYSKFGGENLELVQSFCIYENEPFEVIRFYLERGGRGANNDEELKYTKLKDISNDWLNAIIKYETEKRPDSRFLKHYINERKYRKKNGKII